MNDTECPYVAGYICMCCIIWELLLVYRDVLWTKNKVVVLCCRRQRIIFNSLIKNWPSLKFPLIRFSRKYQYPNTLGSHEEYWMIIFQIFLSLMIFKIRDRLINIIHIQNWYLLPPIYISFINKQTCYLQISLLVK